MDDPQTWFEFAWSAMWAEQVHPPGPEPTPEPQKFFFGNPATRPAGLLKIISIDPAGTVTEHWQTADLHTAHHLARRLAAHVPPGVQVRIRKRIELVNVIELDEPVL